MGTVSKAVDLLGSDDISLTLVDVGASLEPFAPFRPLLGHATYVAFDPDLREMHDQSDGAGRRVVINKAVVADPDTDVAQFLLTENPTCSSTLHPDPAVIGPYLHAHRFDVVDKAEVAATTLDEAMTSVGIERIDWVKLDTQGTDVRLLRSMSDRLWNGLVAVDAEPGFDSYYEGEDTFSDLHQLMRARGFWLADLSLTTGVRVRRKTFDQHLGARSKLQRYAYETTLKRSPMAAGPRYLRTIESLVDAAASRTDYLRLWVCSVVSGNLPFALDVLHACAAAHGEDPELTGLTRVTARGNKAYAARHAWRHAGKLSRRRVLHALRWGGRR
ncbi:MAG TPA: FkbM family methyltransferase [Acidimicrobiales bacterium]|jgi:FkbM family methyltransferase